MSESVGPAAQGPDWGGRPSGKILSPCTSLPSSCVKWGGSSSHLRGLVGHSPAGPEHLLVASYGCQSMSNYSRWVLHPFGDQLGKRVTSQL